MLYLHLYICMCTSILHNNACMLQSPPCLQAFSCPCTYSVTVIVRVHVKVYTSLQMIVCLSVFLMQVCRDGCTWPGVCDTGRRHSHHRGSKALLYLLPDVQRSSRDVLQQRGQGLADGVVLQTSSCQQCSG